MDESSPRPVAKHVEMIEVTVARMAEAESERASRLKQRPPSRRWSAPAGDTAGREAGDDVNAIRFAQGVQSWQYPDEKEAISYKVSYNHTVASTSLLVFLTGTDGEPLTDATSENLLSQYLQSLGCVIIEPGCLRCHAPKKKKYKAPRGVNVCGR